MSVEADGHHLESVVVEYDPAACRSLVDAMRQVRTYFVANWDQVSPEWAIAQADELHDVMFGPPTDDELAGSRAIDLGATGDALRRSVRQPTGAPPPVFRARTARG